MSHHMAPEYMTPGCDRREEYGMANDVWALVGADKLSLILSLLTTLTIYACAKGCVLAEMMLLEVAFSAKVADNIGIQR